MAHGSQAPRARPCILLIGRGDAGEHRCSCFEPIAYWGSTQRSWQCQQRVQPVGRAQRGEERLRGERLVDDLAAASP